MKGGRRVTRQETGGGRSDTWWLVRRSWLSALADRAAPADPRRLDTAAHGYSSTGLARSTMGNLRRSGVPDGAEGGSRPPDVPVVRILLDSGRRRRHRGWPCAAGPAHGPAIPASRRAPLAAREERSGAHDRRSLQGGILEVIPQSRLEAPRRRYRLRGSGGRARRAGQCDPGPVAVCDTRRSAELHGAKHRTGGRVRPGPQKLQDRRHGRFTGPWLGDDNGIYYIRQIGSDIWWSGMSDVGGPADLVGRGWPMSRWARWMARPSR